MATARSDIGLDAEHLAAFLTALRWWAQKDRLRFAANIQSTQRCAGNGRMNSSTPIAAARAAQRSPTPVPESSTTTLPTATGPHTGSNDIYPNAHMVHPPAVDPDGSPP
ncbi:hypothetical protein [Nocardia stercoris]|uniref:hypothetical protein n=1 Tax=Nocardia stercoris TaxID=2483361 RepID=UPI0011C416D1|nr:hypothetical protein [Nocardia stercoris]